MDESKLVSLNDEIERVSPTFSHDRRASDIVHTRRATRNEESTTSRVYRNVFRSCSIGSLKKSADKDCTRSGGYRTASKKPS